MANPDPDPHTEEQATAGAARPAWVPAKLMGLDVGLARIGVALCDPLGLVARPLMVLQRRSRNEDFAVLAQLAADEEVAGVVCGLPLNMDGTDSTQTITTRKWAMRLAHALRALLGGALPVIFWDERLSSYAAREIIAEQGLSVGEDAAAAAVILQAYLDARRAGDVRDFGRIDLPPRGQ
jgi:putative holliday junction resolvase